MRLARLLVVLIGLCICTAATAQEAVPTLSADPQAEAWQGVAGRAEEAVETGLASTFALERLRDELFNWRDQFSGDLSINAGRIATIDAQIAALGPSPESGEEPAEIASRRAALDAERLRLQTPTVLASEAHARANGLIAEIDDVIRTRSAQQLSVRSLSPLNPAHWSSGVQALTAGIGTLATNFTNRMTVELTSGRIWSKLPLLVVYLGVAFLLLMRGRKMAYEAHKKVGFGAKRWRAAWAFVLSLGQIGLPLVGLISLVLAFDLFDLFNGSDGDVLDGILTGAITIIVVHWIKGQLFPTTVPGPLGYDETTRRSIRRLGTALAIGIALAIVLTQIVRLNDATDVAVSVITGPIVIFNVWTFYRLGRLLRTQPAEVEGIVTSGGNLRRLLGLAVMVIAVATLVLWATGYDAAMNALFVPAAWTLAVLGFVIILQNLVSDIFAPPTELSEGETGPLLPVLIGFALFLLAIPPLALIWGARWSDLLEVWTRFSEGVTLGEARISPADLLTFLVVFGIAFLITRFIQSTLRRSVLPRTKLDLGAQNAVVAGVGYVGIFVSAIVAITSAGIDLSNLAIVAGALSVGIGFGLQNIVQNFVSGIILLIERPIGEGDMIAVNGEMGFVRDISVRSTRIETFDRTDVIIPNADLVSGQVTNWTRGNAVGRLILPVGVAYGTDVEQVKSILLEVATAHPMVLLDPPPQVLFMTFGASSLDFEIRVILRDVNWKLVTASEMNEEINKRFVAAGIEIPFAQTDLWLRNPETLRGPGKGDIDT